MIRERLHIRRYRPEDHAAVLELHETALRQTGAFIEDPEMDRDMHGIEASYLSDGEFLVGVVDGQIVAMGALRKTSPGWAEVKRMRVARDHQSLGFGQAVLDALERRAVELGYTDLHLDTGVNLEAARSLYERNGYREARRGKVGPFDCVFYEKSLV